MEIIFVVGKLCSGKTTYISKYPDNCIKIDVGQVVRKLLNTTERTHNHLLDNEIIADISRTCHNAKLTPSVDKVVISGIRQPSILKTLMNYFDNEQIPYRFVYLEVPEHILEFRFAARGDEKDKKADYKTFAQRDIDLGLDEVIKIAFDSNKLTVVQNYKPYETGSAI